ncbi:MAG: amidohydrolase [Phycisphaerales bacterium]
MFDPGEMSEVTGWRQHFHRHPELGFQEHQTAARVADLLESFGVETHRGIGGTGVIGVLKRGKGDRSIALRADMDALPIHETSLRDYRSVTDGVMHACGHDGHSAMLLGAARTLARDGGFDGTVVFIFQPNEEHGLGAQAMIGDGLFEQFNVQNVYGMHNLPGLPVGQFATCTGPITASESLFEIAISARGGHAAMPHMGVDAITVGAELVGSLQTIVSRKLDPGQNGVVSVTDFTTDGGRNILPGKAVLTGDARALTPEATRAIEQRMRQITDGICAAHGVSANVSFDTCFSATINATGPTGSAVRAAKSVVGEDAVDAACAPKLFSEDFAHFAAARPSCFMLAGNGTNGANGQPLHSSDYDFSDDLLPVGMGFWINLVRQEMPS